MDQLGISPQTTEHHPDEETSHHMLRACVQSLRIATSARDRINEVNLFQTGSSMYGEIWAVLSNFLEKYEGLPQQYVYERELTKRWDSGACYSDYQVEQAVEQVRKWMQDCEKPTASMENYIMDLIDWHYSHIMYQQIQDSFPEDAGDPDEAAKKLERLSTKLKSTTRTVQEEKNPFKEDPKKYLRSEVRTPCGVPVIDDLTGGGPYPGEMIGIIMPSGTGKTTLAVQMDDACVRRERHVAHYSFEQLLTGGDLAFRQFVLASEGTRDQWEESNDPDQVFYDYPELYRAWERNVPYWKEYLHMYDEWANPRFALKNPCDLFQPIYKLAEKGIYVRYLTLDWWGPCRHKLLGVNASGTVSDQQKRDAQANYLQTIKNYTEECVENGIPLTTIVYHQMSGQASKNDVSGQKVHSSHEAQEDTSFNNSFDYCAAGSPLDKNNITKINHDKTRGAESKVIPYKLDGNRCVFHALDDDEREKIAKAEKTKNR